MNSNPVCFGDSLIRWPRRQWMCLLILCGLVPAGCASLFKPDTTVARHFVLTAVPTPPVVGTVPAAMVLGIGQVKIPGYLYENSLAVRSETNEIIYQPLFLWAERLDSGIQRILAADLAALLPTDQVRLSAWQPEEVALGLYVTIEQFDVDVRGHAVLIASWRIVSRKGDLVKAGENRYSKDGPVPAEDPRGAVACLSQLLADFSRQVAQNLHQSGQTSDGL